MPFTCRGRNLPGVTEESRFTVAGNNNEYCQTQEIPDYLSCKTCYRLDELAQLCFYVIHILVLKCYAFFAAFRAGFKTSNLVCQQSKLPQDAHRTLEFSGAELPQLYNVVLKCFIKTSFTLEGGASHELNH